MTLPPDNTLAYMDQGSYLALRALGRAPVIQYVWIYDHGVDLAGLRTFHANLHDGLLGRRLERSVVPFGRHHWVRSDNPESLDIATVERSRDEVWDYVEERVNVPVDPEHGPPWHLGVQPLIGGGAVVTLVVSHTVADAGALIDSIVGAVSGTSRNLNYPAPGARTRRQAFGTDLRTACRALREVPGALAGAARLAREQSGELSASARSTPTVRARRSDRPVGLPMVAAAVDQTAWDERAKALGGTSNVLLTGLGIRVGVLMGRVGADGQAMLSLPVSERVEGDTRGNALNSITVHTGAAAVTSDLGEVRRGIKTELTQLAGKRELLLAPLPLVPYTPKFLLRRLEMVALKVGKPIGVSNMADLPKEVNRPDGSEADFFTSRLAEPGLTEADLDRMGGRMMLASGNVAGKVCLSVVAWEPGAANTKAALVESVRQALTDLGLSADVE
jgi:hypothetical protein